MRYPSSCVRCVRACFVAFSAMQSDTLLKSHSFNDWKNRQPADCRSPFGIFLICSADCRRNNNNIHHHYYINSLAVANTGCCWHFVPHSLRLLHACMQCFVLLIEINCMCGQKIATAACAVAGAAHA